MAWVVQGASMRSGEVWWEVVMERFAPVDEQEQVPYYRSQGSLMQPIAAKRRALYFLVVIAALGSAWLSLWAQTSERALLKRDFPILTERVKVSEPSDYVIALDKSLSMKRFWPQVMSSLSSFVGSIPDGDYVSILAFGDSAGYLVTPAPMGPQTRVQIQAALKALPAPDGK